MVATFSRRCANDGSTADVDPLLSLSPAPSSSPSAAPCSAMDLLHLLTSYRSMYEDECQLKQSIIAGLLSSAHSSLSTAQSAPALQQSLHSNLRLLWRAQAGLEQERVEEMRGLVQRDNDWRRQQRQSGETNHSSTASPPLAAVNLAHNPASASPTHPVAVSEHWTSGLGSDKAKGKQKKR